MVEKNSSLYGDETKIFYMAHMEEFIFPRFFALYYQNQLSFYLR